MTLISLERLKELLHYDPQTGIFTRNVRRGNNTKEGEICGSVDADGYLRMMLDGRVYRLQRLAWFYCYGVWPNGVVDHKNRVRDDNRIDNLRDVSQSVNMENQTNSRSARGTGFLGVTVCQSKYQARIQKDGRPFFIGSFSTPEEASRAYWDAKKRLHEIPAQPS
jgi:hypothetical protein